jgi:hypothetical protein
MMSPPVSQQLPTVPAGMFSNAEPPQPPSNQYQPQMGKTALLSMASLRSLFVLLSHSNENQCFRPTRQHAATTKCAATTSIWPPTTTSAASTNATSTANATNGTSTDAIWLVSSDLNINRFKFPYLGAATPNSMYAGQQQQGDGNSMPAGPPMMGVPPSKFDLVLWIECCHFSGQSCIIRGQSICTCRSAVAICASSFRSTATTAAGATAAATTGTATAAATGTTAATNAATTAIRWLCSSTTELLHATTVIYQYIMMLYRLNVTFLNIFIYSVHGLCNFLLLCLAYNNVCFVKIFISLSFSVDVVL